MTDEICYNKHTQIKSEVYMSKGKQTIKIKKILGNKKILLSVILAVILIGSVTTYVLIQSKKNTTEQSHTENSNAQKEVGKISEEAPATPVNPAGSPTPPAAEAEKKSVPEKPANNSNLPEISAESPKLTLEKIEKIKLEMTENDVKSIVGSDVYESAKKAGQNLGSVTINLSDNKGGIIFIFEQGKLTSLTRTYALKVNTVDNFNRINKGMTKEEVIAQLGLPTTETGGKGTLVYQYKYSTNQGEQTKIVVFDLNDKVSVIQ